MGRKYKAKSRKGTVQDEKKRGRLRFKYKTNGKKGYILGAVQDGKKRGRLGWRYKALNRRGIFWGRFKMIRKGEVGMEVQG